MGGSASSTYNPLPAEPKPINSLLSIPVTNRQLTELNTRILEVITDINAYNLQLTDPKATSSSETISLEAVKKKFLEYTMLVGAVICAQQHMWTTPILSEELVYTFTTTCTKLQTALHTTALWIRRVSTTHV